MKTRASGLEARLSSSDFRLSIFEFWLSCFEFQTRWNSNGKNQYGRAHVKKS
jgi:hypothetical protein